MSFIKKIFWLGKARLDDLRNVDLSAASEGDNLVYEGGKWVAKNDIEIHIAPAVTYFPTATEITAESTNNSIGISTYSDTPGGSQNIESVSCNNNIIAIEAFRTTAALGITTLKAGVWDFNSYCSVSSTLWGRSSYLYHKICQVIPASETITTTGTGTSRTATASGSVFLPGDINVDSKQDSFIETSQGIYQITAYTSATEVTISVPLTYVNETTAALKIWRHLFGIATEPIRSLNTNYSVYSSSSVQSAFTIAATDYLGYIPLAVSNGAVTVNFVYGGNTYYSHNTTPFVLVGGVSLSEVKADADIASAISLKHASGSDNQDLSPYALVTTVAGKQPYHGIETAGALSFDNSTHILTIATGCTYWFQGVQKINTGATTCDIDSFFTLIANTLYYIAFDDASGTLKCFNTFWDLNIKVPVATVFWNGAEGAIVLEAHNYRRNIQWHIWAHQTIGCRYQSGINLVTPTTAVDGALSLEGGTLYDEDIALTIAPATTIRGFYQVSSGVYTYANYSLPYLGTLGAPVFLDTDTYSLATFANNNYACYWIYGCGDIDRGIYVIPSQRSEAHNTVALARAEVAPSLAGLNLSQEMKLLYRFIYAGNGDFQESTDYRTTSTLGGLVSAGTTASAVSFSPSGNISATTVQTAIEEIDTEKANLTGGNTYSGVQTMTSPVVYTDITIKSATNVSSVQYMYSYGGSVQSSLNFYRVSGTEAAPTTIAGGLALGKIGFFGQYDTTVGHTVRSAGIEAYSAGSFSGNSYPSYLSFFTSPYFVAPFERMRLSLYGNLLLGTTTDGARLKIEQPTAGIGTVTITGNTTCTGTGTEFTNTFKVGDNIIIGTTNETRAITAIASDTVMTIASATNTSGKTYTLAGGLCLTIKGNGEAKLSRGSLTFDTIGTGINLKQGSNGKCGTFVCNGVIPVTVSNTSIAITDCIFVSLNTVGGTVGALPVIQTITASTGFTIAGTAGDSSTYNYAIISNLA